VDVVSGDFVNFRNGRVVRIEGESAVVTFEIFGRIAGPVSIPLASLRLTRGNQMLPPEERP
jgi:transcription antitermination factor NusG